MAPAESFLLLTSRHNLHPLANRLTVEGARVALVVERTRYEAAWRGRLAPVLTGKTKDDPTAWQALVADLGGDPVVVSDSTKLTKTFGRATGGVRRGYYTPDPAHTELATTRSMVSVGFWWDGETAHAPHVLVEDRGAWPGGMGPGVVGAVTLIRAPSLPATVVPRVGPSVRGLVVVPVRVPEVGKLEPVGEWRAGWVAPHWQAFVAALNQPLAHVLAGTAAPVLAHRFAVALPVSVPPWPLASGSVSCNYPVPVPVVEGLTAEDYGRVLWHDVAVSEGGLRGGGVDGLLGVVKGWGGSLGEACEAAVGVAARVEVPERAFRWDMGRLVPVALVALQRAGLDLHEDTDPGLGTSETHPTVDDTEHSEDPPRSDAPAPLGDTDNGSSPREEGMRDRSPVSPDGGVASPGGG